MSLRLRCLIGGLLAGHAALDLLGMPPWLVSLAGLLVAELWVFAGLTKEEEK